MAKKVTRQGLKEIGGLAGALGQHADATLADLERAHPGAEAAARAILLALTTPQGTRATRSLADLRAAAGPFGAEAAAAFERARLIICQPEVTLAHEALLTQWNPLRTWVSEAREDRLLAEELERDAARWRADPDAVPRWQKHRLAHGEELHQRRSVRLSDDAIAFLKASRRAARRLQWMGAAAAAVVLSLVVGSAGLYIRGVEAQEAATRVVLLKEQASREVAEQQKKELEAKQARIEELVGALGRAPTDEEVRRLQRQLLEVQGAQQAAPPAQAALSSAAPRERPRSSAAAAVAKAHDAPRPSFLPPPKPATAALEPSQQW